MTPSPRQRVLAGLIDAALMVVWALCASGVVWAMWAGHVLAGWGLFDHALLALVLAVLPATVALSVLEAGRYEATPGKLVTGLRVRVAGTGARIGYVRSLCRNLVKLGLPWTLAQLAVLALVTVPAADAAIGTLLSVAVPATYLVSLFVGSGRTPYDWLTGTVVIGTAPGRRVAPVDDLTQAG